MLSGVLKSKLWLVTGGILLLLTAFYLVRETYEKHQIDAEVRKLEDEIAAVEGRNKEILELINYYKTDEYKERQARSILGLAKPGEFVVALPSRERSVGPPATSTENIGNWLKWWNYFFSNQSE